MSLQLWLPLMGDLHNQGLGNYSISSLGTLSWVAGKLGATAIRAGDGTQVINGIKIEDTFTTLLNGNYSVSVWVKPYGQHVHYNGSIFSSGDWNKANKRWAFGVSQDNTKVDVLCMNYNTYINCTVPENEWTHLVCTRDDNDVVKLYKNGEYIGQRDCSSDPNFDSDATFSCIGRESYASGYFSFNGAIQDFRLYDNCLSLDEIKKLSQGLVLYYPLNRRGWGQENLAKNTNGVIVDRLDSTPGSRNEYYAFNCGTPFSVSNGDTVTISFDLYETVNTAGSGYLYIYNTNNKGPHQITGVNVLAGRTIAVGDIIDERISFTTTVSNRNDATQTNDFIEFYSNYGTSNWFKISNLKVEKGSIATPWCPNSSDELATTMGLNSTIEYDCSGFCNNGTKTGTFGWTSDTPKYAVSTTINSSKIQCITNPITGEDPIFSIGFWFKLKSNISYIAYADLVSFSSSSYSNQPFRLEICGNPIGNDIYWFRGPSGNTGGFKINTSNLVRDTWYHTVLVSEGSKQYSYYINGVKTGTYNGSANSWIPTNIFSIGDGQAGAFDILDVRIYATALSVDDVRSLYQNSHISNS